MGTEAAALGLVGASALYGAASTRRASNRARRENVAFNEQTSLARDKLARDQQLLSKKVEQQQRKLVVGQARANRSRLRGGVFGESVPTDRTLNPTLG